MWVRSGNGIGKSLTQGLIRSETVSRATSVKLSLPDPIQRGAFRLVGLLPSVVLAAPARFATTNAAGDRIATEMAIVGTLTAKVPGMALTSHDPVEGRKRLDAMCAGLAQTFSPFAVEEDLTFDGPHGPIGATRYRASDAEPTGLVIFFHGGGWVLGSRASHDSAVRALAVASGADFLSVDYSLAPEAPFPAAVDDALAAWRFAVEKAPEWGIDPARIALAGDSAGGNLSAVVAQLTRGDDVVPRLQALIYPVTDLLNDADSHREFADGFFLTQADVEYFKDHYLPDRALAADPRVSPLLAEDLSGLPPAYVIVAGFDPLRDEGIAYAEAMRDAGVDVAVDYAGPMIHGFLNMGLISPGARDFVGRIAAAIRSGLA